MVVPVSVGQWFSAMIYSNDTCDLNNMNPLHDLGRLPKTDICERTDGELRAQRNNVVRMEVGKGGLSQDAINFMRDYNKVAPARVNPVVVKGAVAKVVLGGDGITDLDNLSRIRREAKNHAHARKTQVKADSEAKAPAVRGPIGPPPKPPQPVVLPAVRPPMPPPPGLGVAPPPVLGVNAPALPPVPVANAPAPAPRINPVVVPPPVLLNPITVLAEGGGDEDPEEGDETPDIHLQHVRNSRVIVGTRGFYIVGGVVYRMIDSDLVPFNPSSKQWEGEILPRPYRIMPTGSVVSSIRGRTGDYMLDESNNKMVLASPFVIIPGFVIEARQHLWFKALRQGLHDLGHNATLGQYFPKGPYSGMTKVVKDIMAASEILAYLRDDKLASGVTPEQVILLTRTVFQKYDKYPIEILIETLLMHTFQRAAAYSEMSATTVALKDHITAGKRFNAYREPYNTNYVVGSLIQGIGDITSEGVYTVNTEDECKLKAMKGLTSITRIEYTTSSDKHGSARDPRKEPGDKFELMVPRNAEASSFNKGATFVDPYPRFDTQLDPRTESRCYQSVGSCFATKMAVIDHKLPSEVEKCALRLTMSRPDEWTLRSNQIKAIAPALAWGRHRTKMCKHPVLGDVTLDEMITHRIKENDPAYTIDHIDPADEVPTTDLQTAILCSHQLYMKQELNPLELVGMVANPLKALHDYIDIVGGPKAPLRHVEVSKVYNNPSVAPKKFNMCKFKPDEAQKYKKDAVGESVLKFGRLTVSITESEWVAADPPVMYAMKHAIESVLIWRNASYAERNLGYLSVMTLGGEELPMVIKPQLELWYRACLTDTSLEQLAVVYQEMQAWVHGGPNRLAAVNHGDDIDILRSDMHGFVYAEEADIADNDGSYTDAFCRFEAQAVGAHTDPSRLYASLANPLLLVNPINEREKLLLRSKCGMLRVSGAINTTYGNCKGSFCPILSYALSGTDVGIVECARRVGFNVTSELFSDVRKSTFLSKFRVPLSNRDGSPKIQVVTCFASILRNFGRCTGDLPGSMKEPVCDRWKRYVRGVVKGYVGEPDSLLMRELRTKFDGGVLRSLYCAISSVRPGGLSDLDVGIVAHYYEEEEMELGIDEYRRCAALIHDMPAFGSVVACAFVDRVMKKRYGMEAVVSY